MIKTFKFAGLTFAALVLSACGAGEPAEPQPVSVQPSMLEEEWSVEWWGPRHTQKLKDKTRQDIELIFIGDSITHDWEETGGQVWEAFYGHRKAFNLGFAGDRTENVLWRLQNGAVDGLSPKLVVMMIGTNNTGHRMDKATDTITGIKAIVSELQTRLPDTNILLLGPFPRGAQPNQAERILNADINTLLELEGWPDGVHFKDISAEFINPDGTISEFIMPDLLHLSPVGYRLWAAAIEEDVSRLLGDEPYSPVK